MKSVLSAVCIVLAGFSCPALAVALTTEAVPNDYGQSAPVTLAAGDLARIAFLGANLNLGAVLLAPNEAIKGILILGAIWLASGIGRTLLGIGNMKAGRTYLVPLSIIEGKYLGPVIISPILPLALWLCRRERTMTMGTLWFFGRWAWASWVAFASFSWWMVALFPVVFFTWATQASRNI